MHSTRRTLGRLPWAVCLLALVPAHFALAGESPFLTPSDALSPSASPQAEEGPIDANAPAAPREGGSLWDLVGADEAASKAAVESSVELSQERLAELGYTGAIGAATPMDYYLDPLATTSIDPLRLDLVDPSEFDIPIIINADVKKWMTYFLGNGRKYYARYLMRSTKWLPMMHAELDARGMPRDLVYLSMIESGFTTSATSYASAAGLWQFMPATGRQYGLRLDWWMDERRDPTKATHAALDYLAYLNRMFDGDWWLAWASYNGGEGRVMKATRRYGTTDFWKIVEHNTLHTETENYVPKLIAAAIIGKHPERYGFVGIDYWPEWTFDEVEIPGSTGVEVIAKCAGVTEEQLLEENPAWRRWALSPEPTTHTVRLPKGNAERFVAEFAKIPPEERVTFARHSVKRGESLATIAKKYNVSTSDLATLNHLSSKSSLKVGQEIIVPKKGTEEISLASVAPVAAGGGTSKSTTSSAPAAKAPTTTTHSVRSGDTLGAIASKYKMSLGDLKSLNGLKGDTIFAGQKLKVSGGASTSPSSGESTKANESSASKATSSAKSETSKGSAESAPKAVSYTVRRGDTLGAIAERYDCSVSELKSWNTLKGSTIYPGQKLKIKR